MVYGDQFDSLFDPVLPVPEDRIRIKKDEETLAIGPERTIDIFGFSWTCGSPFQYL